MKRAFATLAFVSTLAAPAAAQSTQTENAFNWNGRIATGQWIRVRNLNGAITVGQASGDNVEVTATKRWRRGDPSAVTFATKKFGAGEESVVICALWGDRSFCDEDGYRSTGNGYSTNRNNNNDVSVDFRVLVPRGVKVGVATINGDVIVDGTSSDVEAGTINGEVDVTAAGGSRVSGTNVNGNVRARLSRVESDGRLDFHTVNGSVVVEFPSTTNADLDMQTVNGSLNTNFEMTINGRLDPKRIRTHIGRSGGPLIKVGTVNGSIDLRRR